MTVKGFWITDDEAGVIEKMSSAGLSSLTVWGGRGYSLDEMTNLVYDIQEDESSVFLVCDDSTRAHVFMGFCEKRGVDLTICFESDHVPSSIKYFCSEQGWRIYPFSEMGEEFYLALEKEVEKERHEDEN